MQVAVNSKLIPFPPPRRQPSLTVSHPCIHLVTVVGSFTVAAPPRPTLESKDRGATVMPETSVGWAPLNQ